jgi:hypothetical protein
MVAVGPGARAFPCSLAVVVSLATCGAALAADKVACVDAAEAGQRLRKEGHLVAARDRLQVCASRECPDVVSQDCTGWLGEVQRSLGSVVVKAHSASGEAISDVSVFLDGTELAERAPTAAIDVDPGDHVLRCERAGFTPAEQPVRVQEGERGSEIDCRLTPAIASAPGDARVTADPRIFQPLPPKPAQRGPVPWVVWPLGGLGLAGIGAFAYFGLSGKAEENTLRGKTGCAPFCAPEQTDPVQTKFLIADVSLGVGIAALAAAAVVALVHQGSAAPATPAAPGPE